MGIAENLSGLRFGKLVAMIATASDFGYGDVIAARKSLVYRLRSSKVGK